MFGKIKKVLIIIFLSASALIAVFIAAMLIFVTPQISKSHNINTKPAREFKRMIKRSYKYVENIEIRREHVLGFYIRFDTNTEVEEEELYNIFIDTLKFLKTIEGEYRLDEDYYIFILFCPLYDNSLLTEYSRYESTKWNFYKNFEFVRSFELDWF